MKKKRIRLALADLSSPLIDLQRPKKYKWDGKVVIEGVTRTDNFKIIGFTYWTGNGRLMIKNLCNDTLFDKVINNVADFHKAIKKVDKAKA